MNNNPFSEEHEQFVFMRMSAFICYRIDKEFLKVLHNYHKYSNLVKKNLHRSKKIPILRVF